MLYLDLPPDHHIGGFSLSYGKYPTVFAPNIPHLVAVSCQLVIDGYRITHH